MERPSTSLLTGVHTDQPSVGSVRLHGRWLLLARMLWIAIFISILLYFCANLLLDSYDVVTTILLLAATSVWFAVSFVLFWRKSNDRVTLLFSLYRSTEISRAFSVRITTGTRLSRSRFTDL
jgi:drug/metabolite transporter (DMT)-like permease